MDDRRIVTKDVLDAWVSDMKQSHRVVGPKLVEGRYVFADIETAVDLALDYTTTVIPPKKYLFPQRETLLKYHLDGSHMEAVIESEPMVIFGMHTCDMQATRMFDQIFSQGFTDNHYKTRRDDITIISVDCLRPCNAHAYCRDMGTHHLPTVADLHLTDLGDVYLVHINSEKGAALLQTVPLLTVTEPYQAAYDQVLSEKEANFDNRLKFSAEQLSGILKAGYQSDLWAKLGDDCLACGMCTQVCPTCICFDVADEADLLRNEGERVRRWDSCQADSFALVAGGHNFREARAARQRHRYMRKGKYMQDAYGMLGCVGCGRCGETCLVHITPINVLNALYDEQNEEVAS